MKVNPFNITKAVDYSDEEINSYWVDFVKGGFTQAIKPTSPMPMLILGGKGSGKTHVMRYFSYGLQKLRIKKSISEEIRDDGYLGIYMRCSGLNSNRFKEKSQSKEIWSTIFSYYIELWLAQLVVNILLDIFRDQEDYRIKIEKKICSEISDLFDTSEVNNDLNSLSDVLRLLKDLQKKVDFHVNNIALTGGNLSEVKIHLTPGKLIFGIPKILESKIDFFKNCQFIYLIDEFENLTIDQQKYINTLLREKEAPSTFKIGSRLYGVRTYKTYSADEENKENSEYEVYNIDKEFRSSYIDYKNWAKKICLKKLSIAGYLAEVSNESINHVGKYFEEFSVENLNEKLKVKSDRNSRSYLSELKRELSSYKLGNDEIDLIIERLKFNEDRLLERANIFIFYRKWKDGEELNSASIKIQKDCSIYFNEKSKQTLHHTVLDKFKYDLIDKLSRESNEPTPYLGLDNFIKMSAGIPRHLLIILKHVFRWSNFNGEQPFIKINGISKISQNNGLKDAANWFLEDARIAGETGEKVQSSIRRLGYYLKEIRFSHTPPECSISSFRINQLELSGEINSVLKYLEQYSYIISQGQRRDKNTNRQDCTYQINGLIAPYFELSISRRGVLSINKNEANIIFSPQSENQFTALINTKRSKYNPPFNNEVSPLFD